MVNIMMIVYNGDNQEEDANSDDHADDDDEEDDDDDDDGDGDDGGDGDNDNHNRDEHDDEEDNEDADGDHLFHYISLYQLYLHVSHCLYSILLYVAISHSSCKMLEGLGYANMIKQSIGVPVFPGVLVAGSIGC